MDRQRNNSKAKASGNSTVLSSTSLRIKQVFSATKNEDRTQQINANPVISTKCAKSHLQSVHNYAVHRGELKLIGYIKASVREVDKIAAKEGLNKRQSKIPEFFARRK